MVAGEESSGLVLAFVTCDQEEAERYADYLAGAGIKTVIKPGDPADGTTIRTQRPEIWLKPEDMARAKARVAQCEAFRRHVTPNISMLQTRSGSILFAGGCLLIAGLMLLLNAPPWIGACFISVGIALLVGHVGLPRFRQFYLVDLLAFVVFLSAAVGLTLRLFPGGWTSGPIAALVIFSFATLILWAGVAGAMNRAGLRIPGPRLFVWTVVFFCVGVLWFVAFLFL